LLDAELTESEAIMFNLSRRQFVQMAGAGLAAGSLAQAQQGKLTAGEVVERIKKNQGVRGTIPAIATPSRSAVRIQW